MEAHIVASKRDGKPKKEGKEHSYQLFTRFIREDEFGRIDAEHLISKECYDAYLKSRDVPPKLPEESFRKAITSHCKGEAGMKPFEPKVETAIMDLIRQKKVWPCFLNSRKKIGIRGCNFKGYWEKRNDQEQVRKHKKIITSQGMVPMLSGSKRNLPGSKKEKSRDISFEDCVLFKDNLKIYGNENRETFPSIETTMKEETLEEKDSVKKDDIAIFLDSLAVFVKTSEFMEREIDPEEVLSEFRKILEKDNWIKHRINDLFEFIPKKHLLLFVMSIYKHVNFDPLYPKREIEDIEKTSPAMKFFLSRKFCLPEPNEQKFLPNRLIGRIVGDMTSMTIIEGDDNCREIFRGSLVGASSVALRVHKYQGSLYIHEQMLNLCTTGEHWARSIEYRCDKTILVTLCHYSLVDKESMSVIVRFQDVTDQYAELLMQTNS